MFVPRSTYRLQFCPGFPFSAAEKIVPYLADLGIHAIYASPVFESRKGSEHGYDVVDPARIRKELGGEPGFRKLRRAMGSRMGWIQDIVPNHMAFSGENRLLMDVLESGPRSPSAHFFDINWKHHYSGLRNRVLAPFLGGFFGETLENGEIKLSFSRGGFFINYYDHHFPLNIGNYLDVLPPDGPPSGAGQLRKILKDLASLPGGARRSEKIAGIKRDLNDLYRRDKDFRVRLSRRIAVINGDPSRPASFVHLERLLTRQFFRLSYWKVATEEINYRRFFNINELICLNVQDEDVFDHTHRLVLRLTRSGLFSGLRVDHIDGLYDPKAYLERLKKKGRSPYILVEKILTGEESLPADWPAQGTSGYDFLNLLNGLFVDSRSQKDMARIYSRFTGVGVSCKDLIYEKKRLIVGKHMASDIDNLAHRMKEISGKLRFSYDITLYGLKRALVEVMVYFPVYRTYISRTEFHPEDRAYIIKAIGSAAANLPGLRHEFSFIEKFLLLKFEKGAASRRKDQFIDFVMRFQQLTGPLMAKGMEDTTLYVYGRLLSLNEVGGDPDKFGVSPREFHIRNGQNLRRWPHGLTATSTHDTKRSEDVRARINVLSEIPFEWEKALKHWSRLNRKKKTNINGIRMPTRNDEYFLYQTLLGSFPDGETGADALGDYRERIKQYMIKAVREAKVHTQWIKPDETYEAAFLKFIDGVLTPAHPVFFEDFRAFQKTVSFHGKINSLSQVLIKITAAGVPDFYQGSELWEYSLVDPDNRRPVDYPRRQAMLRAMKKEYQNGGEGFLSGLLERPDDGRLKMFVTWRALGARNRLARLFEKGEYVPLELSGKFAAHAVAFLRHDASGAVLVFAPRWTHQMENSRYPLGGLWEDTELLIPDGHQGNFRDEFTRRDLRVGSRIGIAELLKAFPAALLTKGGRHG